MQISAQYVKGCWRKVRENVTDGWTDALRPGRTETRRDGQHHTIIRPV